jgi:ParB-like chromosome segregation protein Spo0J
MRYDPHPAAMLFPMMPEEELQALAEDIRDNGLIDPIMLCDGKILDGRNRYVACERVEVTPRFIDSNGSVHSPTLYVLSKNLHRRHLTISQRAAVAAEAVPVLELESKTRMLAGTLAPIGARGKSAEVAARQVQVSERSVERAIAVKNADTELFEKMKTGEITANAAYERIPHKPVEETKKNLRNQKHPGTQKRDLVTGLSTITGLCRGLESVDIASALSACDEAEKRLWAKRARELANKLRKLAVKIEGATNAE